MRGLLHKLNRKASETIRFKALAFWLGNAVSIVEKGKTIKATVFLEGYQKAPNIVVINEERISCTKKGRKCDSLRRNGVCSHVLAVLYALCRTTGYRGEEYWKLKKKAQSFLKSWSAKRVR